MNTNTATLLVRSTLHVRKIICIHKRTSRRTLEEAFLFSNAKRLKTGKLLSTTELNGRWRPFNSVVALRGLRIVLGRYAPQPRIMARALWEGLAHYVVLSSLPDARCKERHLHSKIAGAHHAKTIKAQTLGVWALIALRKSVDCFDRWRPKQSVVF